MGYQHRVLKASCGGCGTEWHWTWEAWVFEEERAPSQFICRKCRTPNYLAPMQRWPNVPRSLFIGQDKHRQIEVFPVPPEWPDEMAISELISLPYLPYSTRSFVFQMSHQRVGTCLYHAYYRSEVMGEAVFRDVCVPRDKLPDRDWIPAEEVPEIACRVFSGLTLGPDACSVWNGVLSLCATIAERRFVSDWLAFVRNRSFPMLIPQARIGIAQRRRPDFVLFVPRQHWIYKWYAIELDASHWPEQQPEDETRNAELGLQGYEVLSLRPGQRGYFEEVRALAEKVELEMRRAESDPLSVAVGVQVARAGAPIPF